MSRSEGRRGRVLSGMRPTGPLHIGHLLGALRKWVELQEAYECFFMVADWHALMSEYESPQTINANVYEIVRDWLACGIDPERSTIFLQSSVPQHLELAMAFSLLTPLSWLERNPTYKEQLRELAGRDLATFGFLGYPILQTADIVLYQAESVPVGEDQLPHLELAREIVRRFNYLYRDTLKDHLLPEPQAILTPTPRVLGIDDRKMSKSYGNAVALGEDPQELQRKVLQMVHDPQRVYMKDPGRPEMCNVYAYYREFASPETTAQAKDWCEHAKLGCLDCKGRLAEVLIDQLAEIRKARQRISDRQIDELLITGRKRAIVVAEQTMGVVRRCLRIHGQRDDL